MKLKSYSSYDEYVKVQTRVNREKLSCVWVRRKELDKIASYVKTHMPGAKFGLCHGVRNGYEVNCLREQLDFEILGTEISDTAQQFPNVIQWDFHEIKDEWLGRVDLIYSNSWDHSYDPKRLFSQWAKSLSPEGRVFVEWSRNHMPKSVYDADCFGIDYREFLEFLESWFEIEKVLRLNKLYFIEGLKEPLRWVKGIIAPIKVIVARRKDGVDQDHG